MEPETRPAYLIYLDVSSILNEVNRAPKKTREMALVATKLEEAMHWLESQTDKHEVTKGE